MRESVGALIFVSSEPDGVVNALANAHEVGPARARHEERLRVVVVHAGLVDHLHVRPGDAGDYLGQRATFMPSATIISSSSGQRNEGRAGCDQRSGP